MITCNFLCRGELCSPVNPAQTYNFARIYNFAQTLIPKKISIVTAAVRVRTNGRTQFAPTNSVTKDGQGNFDSKKIINYQLTKGGVYYES